MGAFILTSSSRFIEFFEGKNANEFISNISANIFSLNIGGHSFVCVKNLNHENSYVSSLKTAYATYPLEELDLVKDTKLKIASKVALKTLSTIFDIISIDNCIFINNRLISTNFFPKDYIFGELLQDEFKEYIKKYYLCVRNLSSKRDVKLIEELKKNGWLIIPSRIVYVFEYASLGERKRKNHYKKDMSLLSKTSLECVSSDFSNDDFKTMQMLFEALYIEKHSNQNPKYTAKFIQNCYESGFLEIYAFKQDKNIVAFIGVLEAYDTLSTPMLGYDTSLPKELGLYRILCAKLHSLAEIRCLDINFSSGAGEFKKARGAKPILEYLAIYVNELAFYKKAAIKVFAKILQSNEEAFIRALDK